MDSGPARAAGGASTETLQVLSGGLSPGIKTPASVFRVGSGPSRPARHLLLRPPCGPPLPRSPLSTFPPGALLSGTEQPLPQSSAT